ncbi:MAG TPA: HD domain-containing protein [Rhizomicrobium sp.]|nr:HD domain-containing protein [Rhizomicrobium sp.]
MTAIVDRIFELFAQHGFRGYGEDLSLEAHMVQSAVLAQQAGAGEALIAAALLHDIGYFLHPDSHDSIAEGRNIDHEALGAAWLSQAFGEEVTAPVALHVEAKRYLCAMEPGYHDRLSEASKLSLATQGGPMGEAEATAFEKHPAFEAALALRRWDDLGKDASLVSPALESFRDLLTGLAARAR